MSTKTSLQIQFNIIVAIIIKEIKVRFEAKKLGYIWVLIEPILQMLPFFVIRMVTGAWDPLELTMFLLTGIIFVNIFTNNSLKIKNSLTANRALLAYHNVTAFDIALSRLILEAMLTLTVFTLILISFTLLFEYEFEMRNFSLAAFALALYLIFTFSWGVIFMITTKKMPFLDEPIIIICRFLFFVSGSFFSVKDLPAKIQEILLYNPILNVVEIQRYNYLRDQNFNYGDISYILTCTLYSFIFSMLLYHINKQRLI